jgi:hypothetical protein
MSRTYVNRARTSQLQAKTSHLAEDNADNAVWQRTQFTLARLCAAPLSLSIINEWRPKTKAPDFTKF